jgi:hypothetical protein
MRRARAVLATASWVDAPTRQSRWRQVLTALTTWQISAALEITAADERTWHADRATSTTAVTYLSRTPPTKGRSRCTRRQCRGVRLRHFAGPPVARSATHQAAPGRPADAYARDPGSCGSYDARAWAMTSPCAGSHSRTELSSSVPSTTVSYHLHTTTSMPFGPVASATRWPGDTRSTRGEGNIGANPTELTWPWLQTSQACSSTRITRAVRRRCGAKAASGRGVVMCLSLTESRQDQERFVLVRISIHVGTVGRVPGR